MLTEGSTAGHANLSMSVNQEEKVNLTPNWELLTPQGRSVVLGSRWVRYVLRPCTSQAMVVRCFRNRVPFGCTGMAKPGRDRTRVYLLSNSTFWH